MIANQTKSVVAVETGSLINEVEATGTVVSVFGKAVNIRMPHGLLASLVRSPEAMTPLAIYAPDLFADGLPPAVAPGQTARLDARGISGKGWQVNTAGSAVFEGTWKPVNGADVAIDLFEEALDLAGAHIGLCGITRPDGDSIEVDPFVKHGRQVVSQIAGGSRADLGAQLARFIGLGPGFTPAGDDLICGFLLGEQMAGAIANGSGNHAPSLSLAERAALANAVTHTNDGGRTLIWMALQGRFPRFLIETAHTLLRADRFDTMVAGVRKAATHGHSSGIDTLTGLLLYYKTMRSYGLGRPT